LLYAPTGAKDPDRATEGVHTSMTFFVSSCIMRRLKIKLLTFTNHIEFEIRFPFRTSLP
jgi:hypothetical protein